jgi:hypothetical protein
MFRPLIAALVLTVFPAFAQQPAKPAQPPAAAKEAAPAAQQAPTKPSPLKAIGERTQAALEKVPTAKPEDVKSVGAIITALYDVISGPAGQPRDWQRFRSLFYPGAQMMPVVRGKTGLRAIPFTPEDYVTGNSEFFATRGFFEKETHRQAAGYGDLVTVQSAYETYEVLGGPVVARGVNSLQLFFDGQRWWVLNIAWTDEKAAGKPVPKDLTRKE